MVQALLGLEPDAPARELRLDPRLPDWLPVLHLRGLRVGEARVDLSFRRRDDGGTDYTVVEMDGVLHVRPATGPTRSAAYGGA